MSHAQQRAPVPKGLKPSKSAKRRGVRGSWKERFRYAWINTISDMLATPIATFLTVLAIAISITLPSACYILWKNVDIAAQQWYPAPQLTVYFDKSLNDIQSDILLTSIKEDERIERVEYLSRDESLEEFRAWSGFSKALDLLSKNPLPAVAVITPKKAFQSEDGLKSLRQNLATETGIDDVRVDESWYARLSAMTGLVAKVALSLGGLMLLAVFLVIGNSIRLNIYSSRSSINVMKLIGATDGFILRPFLNGGALLGFSGGVMSFLITELLVWRLDASVNQVATIFSANFSLLGFSWDEGLIMIGLVTLLGWFAAYFATRQHLRQFSPD